MILSIVIPIYNGEKYIGNCLDSIISQNLPSEEYEIIVVNDGSKDSSEKILNIYHQQHPNIRIINQENKGQASARNHGIKVASGQYIEFIDGDDMLVPNSLLEIFNLLKSSINQHSGDSLPDMMTFELKNIKNELNNQLDNKIYDDLIAYNKQELKVKHYKSGPSYIEANNYNNGPWYYFIRKHFLINNNIYFEEGKLCEDGMFTLKAYLMAKNILSINRIVYLYINRPGSTVNSKDPNRIAKLTEGFEYAIQYITMLANEYRANISEKCYTRILERRDSYVFFLLIRLLKHSDCQSAKKIVSKLKKEKIYPIKYFTGKEYSKTIKRLIPIINNRCIFLSLCKINQIMPISKLTS